MTEAVKRRSMLARTDTLQFVLFPRSLCHIRSVGNSADAGAESFRYLHSYYEFDAHAIKREFRDIKQLPRRTMLFSPRRLACLRQCCEYPACCLPVVAKGCFPRQDNIDPGEK